MAEDDTPDPTKQLLQYLETAMRNRNFRDMMYLRKTRMDMMQILVSSYQDWFYAEILELKTIAQRLESIVKHPTVSQRVRTIKSNLAIAERDYRRKAIKPIKKLALRASGAKSEEEHYSQFKLALEGAWKMILELRGIRYELDVIATSTGIVLPQAAPVPPSAVYG